MARKRFKCLVEECGHVVRTRSGIVSHITKHHPDKAITLGETFNRTAEVLTNPSRNGPFKTRKKKLQPVITTKTKFIDVPCILRVSIGGLKLEGVSFAG
ncbi:hypothetical protein ES703_120462 [subsurface metagenome]